MQCWAMGIGTQQRATEAQMPLLRPWLVCWCNFVIINLNKQGLNGFAFTALVERVFLRIGSAETDEQLEGVLGKFLAPVLLKLNSSEEAVRKKVFDLSLISVINLYHIRVSLT